MTSKTNNLKATLALSTDWLKKSVEQTRRIGYPQACLVGAEALTRVVQKFDEERLMLTLEALPKDMRSDIIDTPNREGIPAMVFAASLTKADDALAASSMLLEHRGSATAMQTTSKDTPLHEACKRAHWDVVRILIAAGADITIRNNKKALCYNLDKDFAECRRMEMFVWSDTSPPFLPLPVTMVVKPLLKT